MYLRKNEVIGDGESINTRIVYNRNRIRANIRAEQRESCSMSREIDATRRVFLVCSAGGPRYPEQWSRTDHCSVSAEFLHLYLQDIFFHAILKDDCVFDSFFSGAIRKHF